MQKTKTDLPDFKLIGITCRTNNQSEMDPSTAKIGATLQEYFGTASCSGKIPNRKKPGTTYCVYTEYESDVTGDYTYFIGEEVTSFDGMPEELTPLTIPAQHYLKFTTSPGEMPGVCIAAWQEIWALSPADLGSERRYVADFEVYDERAADPTNTTLDIYIGIKN